MKVYSISPSYVFTANRNGTGSKPNWEIPPTPKRWDVFKDVPCSGLREIGKNSYIIICGELSGGGRFSNLRKEDFVLLRDRGIEKIVDLSEYADLKQKANTAGLEYVRIDMMPYIDKSNECHPDLSTHPIFSDLKTPEDMPKIIEFTDNFVKLIKLVQEGNVVVCTDQGSRISPNEHTSTYYYFIKAFIDKKVPENSMQALYVEDIYRHLSLENKKAIGFTPETMEKFEQELY